MLCMLHIYSLYVALARVISIALVLRCRSIKWYVAAQTNFTREGLQGIEDSSASFRNRLDIIASVDSHKPQELLKLLFNLDTAYVSITSVWKFDSIPILAINLRT